MNCQCTETKGCAAHYLAQSIRENSTDARELGGFDYAERLAHIADEMEGELNGILHRDMEND